jgi:hypothetical protein
VVAALWGCISAVTGWTAGTARNSHLCSASWKGARFLAFEAVTSAFLTQLAMDGHEPQATPDPIPLRHALRGVGPRMPASCFLRTLVFGVTGNSGQGAKRGVLVHANAAPCGCSQGHPSTQMVVLTSRMSMPHVSSGLDPLGAPHPVSTFPRGLVAPRGPWS